MKRTILLVLMAAVVILGSCKKESKEDPVTPTPTPESDTLHLQYRFYANLNMMQYLDYKLYATLPGESEKEVSLVNPQLLDTNIDISMMRSITFFRGERALQVAQDSFRVYVLDFATKKGTFTFRQDVKVKNVQKPDSIDIGCGYTCRTPEYSSFNDLSEVGFHFGVYTSTNTLNRFISLNEEFKPITFTVK